MDVVAVLGAIPGWTWGSGITGPNSTRGDKGLERLRSWMSMHLDMPRYIGGDRGERSLADLVSRQRRRYRAGALSAQRIAALEGIPGWSWYSRNRPFGEVAAQLERWIAEHGRRPANSTRATDTERGLASAAGRPSGRFGDRRCGFGSIGRLGDPVGYTCGSGPGRPRVGRHVGICL